MSSAAETATRAPGGAPRPRPAREDREDREGREGRERRGRRGGWVRRLLFARLMLTLGVLLGVMQVVVGHWVTVVLAGRPGPGLGPGLVLAAALVAANCYAVPVIRWARRRGGWGARVARAYAALGLATLLLGTGIVAAWLGWLPLAQALGALGIGGEEAFRVFRVATIPVVGALAFTIAWGFTVGPRRIDRTRVEVELPGLPAPLHGLRVVHISDLHIGNGLEAERLARMVREVNALDPDLVALTGDIFDHDPRFIEEGARGLGGLRARYGVYAVLGNHDAYTGAERVAEGLARHAPGIRVLRGEIERVPTSQPLYVAGVDDPGHSWTARDLELRQLEDLARRRPDDGPTLLLVHRPELFGQAARLGFRLVLAGHTHGGQIALPLGSGRLNVARLVTRYHRGLYRENGATLYVNRGYGVAGPAVRINCPREIATLHLKKG